MLSKSFTASILLLALTSSANAQDGSVISPALGISGTPGSGDIQKPSDGAPCGDTSIPQNIDGSTPVVAGTNGQFIVSAINFGT